MKKAIVKQLRAHALTLPKLSTMEHRSCSGQELLDLGIKFEEDEKTPIDPDKRYVGKLPTPINHENQLKKAYKTHGLQAIPMYTQWCVSQYNAGVDAMNQAIENKKKAEEICESTAQEMTSE